MKEAKVFLKSKEEISKEFLVRFLLSFLALSAFTGLFFMNNYFVDMLGLLYGNVIYFSICFSIVMVSYIFGKLTKKYKLVEKKK